MGISPDTGRGDTRYTTPKVQAPTSSAPPSTCAYPKSAQARGPTPPTQSSASAKTANISAAGTSGMSSANTSTELNQPTTRTPSAPSSSGCSRTTPPASSTSSSAGSSTASSVVWVRSSTWSRTRLRYLLVNPRYAGLVALVPAPADTRQTRPQRIAVVADSLVLDRDENPVHGRWEPIVDEATWRESVRLMRSRALGHVRSDRRYFGTGIFRCGVCGGPLFVSAGSYRCPTVGHVSRRREPIDKLALATVRECLARGDMAGLLPHEDDGRMTEIREELTKCESELARIRDDYRAHLIDGAFYAELREELTARRDAALAERDRLTRDPTGGVLTCDDPVAGFDAVAKDPVRLHAIVDYLLEVTIHPDPRKVASGTAASDTRASISSGRATDHLSLQSYVIADNSPCTRPRAENGQSRRNSSLREEGGCIWAYFRSRVPRKQTRSPRWGSVRTVWT